MEREIIDPAGIVESAFRFIVLTDTHINASEDETPSPWAVNRLANARARATVDAINAISPDFAVHLGDLIHPLPGHRGYSEASERAEVILGALRCQLHVIPGNHDVGDKPLAWSPAETISSHFVDAFVRRTGSDRFCFGHRGSNFIGFNNQLLNSGTREETEQWDWLEECLSEARGNRTFLFMHYPPFICASDEHEHYDNLGQPGRQRLLKLIERHDVEACFSGHVHNFFYNRIGPARSYTAPAVSAIRHDFADLFPVPPGDDSFGRDDREKLGFLVVDVDHAGHIVRFVRSMGGTAAPGERLPRMTRSDSRQPFRLPFCGSRPHHTRLGATLRRRWCDVVEVTPSGAVDEFRRKPARDDYLITALWETGIDRLRIPADDVLDERARERIRLLAADGYAFQLFCFGVPGADVLAGIGSLDGAVRTLEIICFDSSETGAASAAAAAASGCELVLSRLIQSGHDRGGSAFVHFISHGYAPTEPLPDWIARSPASGISFRIEAGMDVTASAAACARKARDVGKKAHLQIALHEGNPAAMPLDKGWPVEQSVRALLAAHRDPDVIAWLDSLTDIDRGYFPHRSLIDARSNPHASIHVLDELLFYLNRQPASATPA